MARPSDDSRARVGVVTVVYRSNDVLPGFIASLERASAQPTALVVVDNHPGPDSQAEQFASAAGGRYVALPGNPGYGGGMNAGVATLPASVDWILISNPDVVLHPGAIDVLVAAGEQDERIGAVGPAVLNPDGSVYPSARRVPSLRLGVGHALFVNLWQDNPWTKRYRHDEAESPSPRDAGWLSGSCVLVRRSAYAALGGFDDGYFMYFEDVDLGMRLTRNGWRNRYEPAAQVTHSGAHATDTQRGAMVRAHHDSALRFLTKKYPGPLWLPVRLVLRVGLRFRSLVVEIRRSR
jgi:N-acetylglucosaminyl-diphospho-decaprenol L-rhamnosyltransferase